MKRLISLSILITLLVITQVIAQPTPPPGKKWQKIENMSDEFNGSSLDFSKWDDQSPQWAGRVPGLFTKNAVTVADGNLRLTAGLLPSPQGNYTHQGALVRSKNKTTYGYFETKMKANKTFMSSTFWLINKRSDNSGCDARVTELDITETVGTNTGGANWINNTIKQMNSNTHSRNTSCNNTPIGSKGNKVALGRNSYEGYHIYGVWWKSATELLFYLDNKFVYSITPPANFNIDMYLRMVVETYDWNPPKAGSDGINGSFENRTTYYDWTRSWKLVEDTSNNDSFYIVNKETGGKISANGTALFSGLKMENANTTSNTVKWTMINSGNGYFHLKNVATNLFFRPFNDANPSTIQQVPNTYLGYYTQWKKIPSSNGYFYLQNRKTGMYFRPVKYALPSNLEQRPTTWSGNYTQWIFKDVNTTNALKQEAASKQTLTTLETAPKEEFISVYPNPSNGILTISGLDNKEQVFNIVNILGATVQKITTEVLNGKVTLDLEQLESGTYFISSEDKKISKQIIINK